MPLWDGMTDANGFHFLFALELLCQEGHGCAWMLSFQRPDVRHDADPNCRTSHCCAPRKRSMCCSFREATFVLMSLICFSTVYVGLVFARDFTQCNEEVLTSGRR